MRRIYRHIPFIVLLILFLAADLSANPRFKTLNTKDGLEDNAVRSIYRDPAGFVWLGTVRGLNRYDGREIKSFKRNDPFQNWITQICEARDGRLLLCSRAGLLDFNRQTETYSRLVHYSDLLYVNSIAISDDGQEYYLGNDKWFDIYNVKNKTIKRFSLDRSGLPVRVAYVLKGPDRSLWLSTARGVYRFFPKSQSFQYLSIKGVSSVNVMAIAGDLLIIGADQGLFIYNMVKHTSQEVPEMSGRIILSLAKGENGTVYVGSDGFGVSVYDLRRKVVKEQIVHSPVASESLASNCIYSLFYDKDKILWAGNAAGASYSQNYDRKFHSYDYNGKFYLKSEGVRSIYIGDHGLKLIGTLNGMIVSDYSGNSFRYDATNGKTSGLRANIITSISPVPGLENQFLIGTYGGGVSVFDALNHSFSAFINSPVLLQGRIYGFATDPYGYLWIGTTDGIVKCQLSPERKIVQKISVKPILDKEGLRSIYADRKGCIWAGGLTGIVIIDSKTSQFIQLNEIRNAVKDQILNFFEDKEGYMWVGTSRSGVVVFNAQHKILKHYTIKDGLPDNSVTNVLQDDKGDYWISTNKGFAKLSKTTGQFRNFSLLDGLPGMSIFQEAAQKDSQGNFWLGGENGLIYFRPEQVVENRIPPAVAISDVFINEKRHTSLQRLDVQNSIYRPVKVHGARSSVIVKFVAWNYFNSGDNHFRYMLKGYDKQWTTTSTVNQAQYTDLSAGKYKFIVYGSNNDEVWGKEPAVIPIIVSYYFYKTGWFYLLCMLLILGSAYWGFRSYFKMSIPRLKELMMASLAKREPSKLKFSEDKGEMILKQVRQYMESEKPYLKADFKLPDLAEATGLPVHEISHAINRITGENFTDFINDYRINEIKDRILRAHNANLKIMAIAEECGFNSRHPFYRAFKRVTGTTPGEFFKQIDSSE